MKGVVTQCLSNGRFRIQLENQFNAIGYISGKLRKNFIRILLGDFVIIELSPYDLTRGRIVYRLKPGDVASSSNSKVNFFRKSS